MEAALSTSGTAVAVAGALLIAAVATQGGFDRSAGAERKIVRQVSPLENPRGTRAGLDPLTSRAERAAAVRLIKKVRVRGMGSKAGYSRARFGENWADTARGVPYARNGCRTRDDLLARDGEALEYRRGSRCVVVAMRLRDPYTGRLIRWSKRDSGRVQVDHVVPLSYEWRMGASRWPRAKRVRIANDPLNLMPVYGPVNEAKGGAGPASWLPPVRRVRCAYVARFAQVAVKYGLPVTRADKAAMLAQCR
ncbi:HNH endonuclease family protein [Sphaerisporangium sp. TRM90804]|uniref:HNH endonuclease family protein n=1 Tax=Sphaerisporangium sp. TRM90804 TaxID=3031113 RepID=UPI002447C10E|nr:HNH endonuclease family protein [Sphaerisporangium sp. TRM90804]MDH2426677.1 HNH endonuclease family protein [Sphaerisporangium sp. TRM90804]